MKGENNMSVLSELQTRYEVEFTLLEPMIGTVPKNADVYSKYIASKAPEDTDTDDEVATVSVDEKAGWTGFHHDEDGNPCIYNYMVKGFLKNAASVLAKVKGTEVSKVKAFKQMVNRYVDVSPRLIPIDMSGDMGVLERPLRASTPQGERVALAKSDTVPKGSTLRCTIAVLGNSPNQKLLEELLSYGELQALGQWRNADYGRVSYTIKKV